ncbi:hypothetical protein A2631_04575 [Candidatus Daviesbacteria bacterium RIFCSPHIGHO2_01_FULL_44_29]|uniref:J domain-containing protein n=1 Tax=Candidatus Daviesbacteria bacterium RIFCSPHIGHO2_02_FULL_43_12 TaxID=1797776 RepID=A0A1F5KGD7_9BACT|nr:MAG: hypothetical protein A2631_04575 [Candidatus Daviesbacteria bacterium RIFCSPHIGHO2_01_FULL_44_29]OGE39614.1 MAG: hypothetical protein A3E86_05730 [Candidatus Daviesbacteria bacterium RIFCSPHIGHO2_12_FULL_47_45]OGE39996.1 MAG: hypothetical protein A3D25_04305 [Candidatus Daviesbacteria bacterium RIFCSPHIGHO2_02_FULL_43_12]
MATKKDYYEILGVSKAATDTELKSAYRKLARQFHPDVNKTPEAAERFKEVSDAYQILSDPRKRQTYDQFGSSAFEPGAGGGSPFGQGNPFGNAQGGPFGGFSYSWSSDGGGQGFEDPFALFEQLFGGSGFGDVFRRRPTYQMQISFDEAIHGTTKEVEVEHREKNGQTKRERMNVKIPAGVDNGTKMRFGEVDLIFRVTPHPEFAREGANVFSEVKLSIPQVVLGDIISVKTVEGPVSLKVPAGTEPGTLIKIKGKGAASLRGGSPRGEAGKGDHYVRVKIEIPKSLTAKERQAYQELKESSSKKKGWF